MPKAILSVLTVLLVAAPAAQKQYPSSPSSLDLTAEERQAIVKAYPDRRSTRAKSFDAGKHIVEYYVDQLVGGPQSGSPMLHTEMTEIYYIVEGAATFVTGGRRIGPEPSSTTPGTIVGGRVEGGVARTVKAGDVVTTPPGTFHAWKSVDTPKFVYIAIHVDPEKKVSAGYIDPVLKK